MTPTLLDQARAEHAAKVAAEQAAAAAAHDAAVKELHAQVQSAVTSALVKLDGTRPTWQSLGLRIQQEDITAQRAIVATDGVALLVQPDDDGRWQVFTASWDGRWVQGALIRSLADLGAALSPESP